jgi:CDP-diacylglycerol--glycerol-3-phosphate 3-phosphatidyltransferase
LDKDGSLAGGGRIRHVPNILTGLRIAAAALMPLTGSLSPAFFALYAFCGVSDILDGFLARKFRCESSMGAALDSAADFVFVAAALFSLIPALPWRPWMLLWAGGIALLRFASAGTGWLRFRKLAFLHTYLNKAAGAALYLLPFAILLWGLAVPAAIACAVASLSAAEEFALMATSAALDRDARGWFFRHA